MTESELIDKFLDIDQPMENRPPRFSTLVLLLKNARSLSGRNIRTGVYEKSEINKRNFDDGTYLSFQFSGLISYLIFLEQIGSIFKIINKSDVEKTPIYRALRYFSDIESAKIEPIVSLRNSMTHKFGLATESNPGSGQPRKFSLSIERNSQIVQIPLKEWDGKFSDKSDESNTIIYIHDLIDLIESVYQKIYDENSIGNLQMVLKEGINEFYARYTIIS